MKITRVSGWIAPPFISGIQTSVNSKSTLPRRSVAIKTAMHPGKVVGVPIAGWIIYTGGTQLIDGTDMELHPRPVDVTVELHNGDTYRGEDAQLDAHVK